MLYVTFLRTFRLCDLELLTSKTGPPVNRDTSKLYISFELPTAFLSVALLGTEEMDGCTDSQTDAAMRNATY